MTSRIPTDDLLAALRVALLLASEEKAIEKLKQLLARVVDMIVVEGRDHIRPYSSCPGFLHRSLRRRGRDRTLGTLAVTTIHAWS